MAIDAGKKLVEKAAKRLSTPKSQVANAMIPPEEITKKVNEVIAKYVDTSAINLNKLIDGSSINRPTASNAIAIQDLEKPRFIIVGLQMAKDGDETKNPFTFDHVSLINAYVTLK